MRPILSLLLVAVIGFCGLVIAPNQASAQEDEEPASVESLSSEAAAKYRDKDYEGAIVLFKQAYAITPVPNLLFNTAKCYEKLSDYDGAIEYYQKFLVEPDVDKQSREKALVRIDELKTAKAAKEKAAKGDGKDPKGEDKDKNKKPVVTGPDHTAAYVTMGVGGALILGGVAFGVLANGQQTTFDDATTPEDKQSAKDTGETYAVVADVFYASGAIALIVGTVLYFTADSPSESAEATAWSPFGWVGENGAGVGVGATF